MLTAGDSSRSNVSVMHLIFRFSTFFHRLGLKLVDVFLEMIPMFISENFVRRHFVTQI